jgi:hypothetical protein
MTAFFVEMKEARLETRSPCQGEPRSFGFASLSNTEKTKTRRWRVKIDIHDQRAIYPDESPLNIFKSLLRVSVR